MACIEENRRTSVAIFKIFSINPPTQTHIYVYTHHGKVAKLSRLIMTDNTKISFLELFIRSISKSNTSHFLLFYTSTLIQICHILDGLSLGIMTHWHCHMNSFPTLNEFQNTLTKGIWSTWSPMFVPCWEIWQSWNNFYSLTHLLTSSRQKMP